MAQEPGNDDKGKKTINSDQAGKAGAGIAIGIGVGVALGVALNNIALGVAIGVALGFGLMGAFMSQK